MRRPIAAMILLTSSSHAALDFGREPLGDVELATRRQSRMSVVKSTARFHRGCFSGVPLRFVP